MPFVYRVTVKLITILTFAMLSSCAWLPLSDTPESQRIQGLMQLTAQNARLESCAGPIHEMRADPALRALFNQVVRPGQTAVFVDLDATVLSDERIQPEKILRMGSTGVGCSDPDRQASQWLALSEQPAWGVWVEPSGLRIHLAKGEVVQAAYISEQLPDGARSYRTLNGDPAELWIYPQPCFAPQSGDYYEHTARLLQAGRSLGGCAYRGLQAVDQPPR